MPPTADQILDYLSRHRIRATYGAVGGVLGVPPRSIGKELGPRCPRASWVVSRDTGKPSGYQPHQLDPELTSSPEIITDPADLLRRMQSTP